MNLYNPRRKGYYIYVDSDRNEIRYQAKRKHACGYVRSATFHTVEDAVVWLDSLIGK
jgi:hypothetical protein